MGIVVGLDLYSGGVPLEHYEFASENQRLVRMGRLSSAQVRIDDPLAARIHAIIELSTTHAMLVDMGAEAGTFVNGKRITKVKLAHGDQITIGNAVLLVGVGASSATVASPLISAYAPAPGPAISAQEEVGKRLVAKTSQLSAEALLEAERYIDWLIWRERGGPQEASPPSVVTLAPPSIAQTAEQVSPAVAAYMTEAPPAPPVASFSPPVRDTQTQLSALRRGRRTKQIVVAVVMFLVVIVLAVMIFGLGTSPQVPDAAIRAVESSPATKTPAPQGAKGEAGIVSDEQNLVHRLTKEQSLRELAVELFGQAEHAALLTTANPGLGDAGVPLAAGTAVRLPRTMTYVVKPGDTLARIAASTLGRADAYGVIQQANQGTLQSSDSLEVGMTLVIPLIDAEVLRRLESPQATVPAPVVAPKPHAVRAEPKSEAEPIEIPEPVGAVDDEEDEYEDE